MTEPFELTVAEAANRIRRGDLSSLDLAESLLARLGRLEPDLRAWVTIDREGVLEAARSGTGSWKRRDLVGHSTAYRWVSRTSSTPPA